jgi:hypothetical protein
VRNSNQPFSLSVVPSLFSFPSLHEQAIFELLLPLLVPSSSPSLEPVLPVASCRSSPCSFHRRPAPSTLHTRFGDNRQ